VRNNIVLHALHYVALHIAFTLTVLKIWPRKQTLCVVSTALPKEHVTQDTYYKCRVCYRKFRLVIILNRIITCKTKASDVCVCVCVCTHYLNQELSCQRSMQTKISSSELFSFLTVLVGFIFLCCSVFPYVFILFYFWLEDISVPHNFCFLFYYIPLSLFINLIYLFSFFSRFFLFQFSFLFHCGFEFGVRQDL
jgi:hypothetical protein